MRRRIRSVGLVVCMIAALLVPMTGAVAQVPSLGDVEPGNTSPHGGYSAATDYCLQCHDVHQETIINEYALLRGSSINAVCQTCHALGATTAPVGYSASAPSGTVSSRAVYTNGVGSDHNPAASQYGVVEMMRYEGRNANSTDAGGGLTCANCHTPHGDFGQLINNWTLADEGVHMRTTRTTYAVLDFNGTDGAWMFCPANSDGTLVNPADPWVAGDGYCADGVFATVSDAKGNDAYMYGYKLLSSGPNHQYDQGFTWETLFEPYNDMDPWCATCHYNKIDEEGVHNNHPHCTRCHGNPDTLPAGAEMDYPHSSALPFLLSDVPDALCVNCHPHSPGYLP